jgi:hypothetical protein
VWHENDVEALHKANCTGNKAVWGAVNYKRDLYYVYYTFCYTIVLIVYIVPITLLIVLNPVLGLKHVSPVLRLIVIH